MKTCFAVLTFRRGRKGGLIPDHHRAARDEGHCIALAERLSKNCHAALAFSRRGDLSCDDWGEPVVLAKYGPIPDGILEATN